MKSQFGWAILNIRGNLETIDYHMPLYWRRKIAERDNIRFFEGTRKIIRVAIIEKKEKKK